MEDVVKAYKCRFPEERISILRLELDYELAILHEAMIEKSAQKMDESKERLMEIRDEMMLLEAL